MLGTDVTAHVLSAIYLWFLPLVPLALTAWLIWSRNISFGYWFATSQCIAWTLGTASYYALPTLGPGFALPLALRGPRRHPDARPDGVAVLRPREASLIGGVEGAVQSVAGFASLHVRDHPAGRADGAVHDPARGSLHWIFWANFVITVVATLYFGWHYVADDIAGILIALVAFYLGGVASGQKFDRHGLSSHPTTTTSRGPGRRRARQRTLTPESPPRAGTLGASRAAACFSERRRRLSRHVNYNVCSSSSRHAGDW